VQLETLFTGQLVRLAAPRPEDHETFARWSEQDGYQRTFDNDPARPISAEAHAAWETPYLQSPNSFIFRMRTLTDDALIGVVALGPIEWMLQCAMLGIAIGDPDDWGKGYGSDAITLMLRYAFHELNLYRVWLSTIAYNTRAVRVFEKAGFKPEGAWREMIHRDGRRFDVLQYGMLRHEWEALQRQ
jgi:RimJ/RimL family protein N-acetyltransferase